MQSRFLYASLIRWLEFGLVALLFAGCESPPAQKKAPSPNNNTNPGLGADYSQCTASSCPASNPQVYVNGIATPNLTANVNQAISWSVSGKDSLYSSRSFAVVRASFNPAVAGLNIQQNSGVLSPGGGISISGQLTAAQVNTSSTLSVVIRDMTACQVLSGGSSGSICSSATQTTQYDKTATAYLSVANNQFNPNGTLPGINNNSGDLGTRIGIAVGLGALRSLLSGGDILSGALDGLQSGLQSSPQTGGLLNLFSNGGAYSNATGNGTQVLPTTQPQGN